MPTYGGLAEFGVFAYNAPMKDAIIQLLKEHFQPDFLDLEDQSASHAGHNIEAKEGGTHFALTIVSQKFRGKSRVERHRMIYKALEGPIKARVHALAISALSPDEFKS